MDAPGGTSGELDRSVRAAAGHLSMYDLDVDLLAKPEPGLVVTQDLCQVCAISYDTVCAGTPRWCWSSPAATRSSGP
ncbi:MAG: hypothetical protein ACJ75M_21785 [Actinomycetes bacterium]